MSDNFELGQYVYCISDNYCINSWDPRRDIRYARFYKIINTMTGATGPLICLEGPYSADLSFADGGKPASPLTSYRSENFKDATPHITERGMRKLTNNTVNPINSSSIKWVDVRAIVFDNGSIVSRHASREEAKIAVQELLKRNPLKQYDVFEYQATGKLPELPVVWDDRTIYTNENNA